MDAIFVISCQSRRQVESVEWGRERVETGAVVGKVVRIAVPYGVVLCWARLRNANLGILTS